jgi:hypothetical protein
MSGFRMYPVLGCLLYSEFKFEFDYIYNEHPNTGLSGIRMVIFRTLEIRFSSGKKAAILLKQFENQTFCVRFSNVEN